MSGMKAKVKRKNGRPTKYDERFNDIAYQVCKQFGAADKQLAKTLGVTESTLNLWKLKHPEFSESLKKGKDEYDTANVEVALRERAIGYQHPDVHISMYKGEIIITDLIKYYPPDPLSCIFWLVNRSGGRWKHVNKTDIDIGPNVQEYFDKIADAIDRSDSHSD